MNYFKVLLSIVLFATIFLINPVLVRAGEAECANSKTWAIDKNPNSSNYNKALSGFTCRCINNPVDKQNLTIITHTVCGNACGQCGTDQLCRCVREPDCNAIGGICFNKNKVGYGNQDKQYDNLSQDQPINGKLYKIAVKYRCPEEVSVTCYVSDNNADTAVAKTKSVQTPAACEANKSVTGSGGPGLSGQPNTTQKIVMNKDAGDVTVSWTFYNEKDRLIVKDAKGKELKSSGSAYTAGSGSLVFQYDPAVNGDSISVSISSDPSAKTSIWEYQVTCPSVQTPILQTVTPPNPTLPASVTTPTRTVKLSECCSNLVPEYGNAAYIKGEYVLGHFVQIAVNIYKCILCLVGALILLMFVLGAFFMLTSAGDSNRVSTGKKIITAAVVGGIIVFSSFLIINFTVMALGGSFVNDANLQIDTKIQ